MPQTVVHSIGTRAGRDYSTVTAWAAAIPRILTLTRSNNCGTGSTNSAVVLDATASSSNGTYNQLILTISGESRLIIGYVSNTKTATVTSLNGSANNFTTAPTNGTPYVVEPVSFRGEMYNDSIFTDNTLVISGHTTNAVCNITLTAASGQSFVDQGNIALKYDSTKGVSWSTSSSYGYIFQISDSNFTMSRIQCNQNSNAQVAYRFYGVSNCGANSCIFVSTARNNYSIFNLDFSKAYNCLIINADNAGQGCQLSHASILENCTVICYSDLLSSHISIGSSYGNNSVVKNCAIFGYSGGFSGTFATGSCSNNVTDVATCPGSNNFVSKTFTNQFYGTTSSSPDFRLKNGSDCIDNAATDLTNVPTGKDIIGTSRPQGTAWDVGAWEALTTAIANVVILSLPKWTFIA